MRWVVTQLRNGPSRTLRSRKFYLKVWADDGHDGILFAMAWDRRKNA